MAKGSFLLTKWYLDCIADNGDAAIVYLADLQWMGLSLHYSALLTALDGKVRTDSSIKNTAGPRHAEDLVSLTVPALKLEGTWLARRPPIRKTMFKREHGRVDWHCMQPMSDVDLRLGDKVRLHGLGYAECLTLSILPWQLPISCLHWGRYLTPQDALVWVDWQGKVQRRIILYNGEEVQADLLDESQLVFPEPEMRLDLDRSLILRTGQLGDTVFSKISRLAGLLPQSVLAVDECKWRSRGTLRTPNGTRSGWAIHEVVKWNG